MTHSKPHYRGPFDFLPTPSPSPDPTSLRSREGSSSSISSSISSPPPVNMATSRPISMVPSMANMRMPTLQEILTDSAPQPYTLSAFMGYLAHNHCLETLEFTLEAERYRVAYSQALFNVLDNKDHVCDLWQKLMQAHIEPYAPREVNLPGPVKATLLKVRCTSKPPHPSELDEAVRIIYELMSDSVLVPFFESFPVAPPQPTEYEMEVLDQLEAASHGSGKSRKSPSLTSSHRDRKSSRSPKTPLLPHFTMSSRSSDNANRHTISHLPPQLPQLQSPSSFDLMDCDRFADNTSSHSPELDEFMTPPMTPPTPDWSHGIGAVDLPSSSGSGASGGSSSSSSNNNSGNLQRVMSAHNSGWKKMGVKLGLSKRSSQGSNRSLSRPSTREVMPRSNAASPRDEFGALPELR